MAKRIILIVVLITISQKSYSQINLGVNAGLNYVINDKVIDNTFRGINYNETNRVGFHIGLYGVHELSNKYSISSELVYSKRGFGIQSVGVNQYLNYINLPVHLGFKISKKLIFLLGPELGYLISDKVKNDPSSSVILIGDNKFDLGISGGCRYLASSHVQIDLKYIHGVTSVMSAISTREIATDDVAQYQSRTFQIGVGYRLK